ncbi:hypothetical protein ANCCEY_14355 [Ancylostoma ceylanicum]|uniref:Uncharacterized protein n=2 Tax=Ancylostoma ceylanicum TaxID=53326 RepID=A0A0D6LFV9_9BILA|nr:hypothetical protein ANCCEY_14355 [Ancylostoma ceylanicum]
MQESPSALTRMFYYYLFLFCLLYDFLLNSPCSAHYFLNRHTKEIGRTLPKYTLVEKDDLPQYIDEVVEVPTDERPFFENLRLAGYALLIFSFPKQELR